MKTYTANVLKESKDSKLGILLSKKPGSEQLLIKTIKGGSVLAPSDRSALQPGLQIVKINGAEVGNLTPQEAASLLTEAEAGEINVIAQGYIAKGIKEERTSKVGISFQKHPALREVTVFDIASDGILANQGLQVGQKVTGINGQECPADANEAIQLLKDAEREVILVTVDYPDSEKTGTFTAVSTKASKSTKVGISTKKSNTLNAILITAIPETSLFHNSSLRVGMKIVSINGAPCPAHNTDAIKIIKNTEGELKIEAVFVEDKKLEAAAAAVAVKKEEAPKKAEAAPAPEEEPGIAVAAEREIPMLKEGQLAASVKKPSKESKVGILFYQKKSGNKVLISKVKPDGLFRNSGLKPGQTLISINGTPCPPTATEAVELVQRAAEDVTIIAASIIATAEKSSKDAKAGISFGKGPGYICIAAISKGGLFASSSLQVGQKVIAVNGNECPSEVKEAIELVRNTEGKLTLETVDVISSGKAKTVAAAPTVPDEAKVTATVTKPSKDASLGIAFLKKRQSKRVVISKILDEGLFAKSDLRAGQTVVSINGQACPPSVGKAIKMLKDAAGELTIVAANTVAKANKDSKDSKVGLSVGKLSGMIVICEIAKDGIFSNSTLREEQVLVSINGQACPDNTKDVIQMIKDAEGELKIVAVDVFKTQKDMMVPKPKVPPKPVEAVVMKQQNIGLELCQGPECVLISKIEKPGLFGYTNLQEGQRLLSINGTDCPVKLPEAQTMLDGAAGRLVIVAVDTDAQPVVPEPPASEITATALKATKDSLMGIAFSKSVQKRVIISRVSDDGLFADQGVQVGQAVVSINGQPCPSTNKETAQTIKDAEGSVTIVTQQSVATAEKKERKQTVGISLGKLDDDIVICQIAQNGLFGASSLMPGQQVVSINGQDCPKASKDAVEMIKACVGPLTIVAVDVIQKSKKVEAISTTSKSVMVGEIKDIVLPPPPPKPVEAIVMKETKDSRLGLTLGQGSGASVLICFIEKPGLFAYTNLKVLQRIVSVNGTDCPSTSKEAFAMLKDVQGKLTLVAVATDAELVAGSKKEFEGAVLSEGQVMATAIKESAATRVGIKCKQRGKGRVVMSFIGEDGLFKDSDLRVGQTVISINGQTCPDTPKEATALIKSEVGEVTVVAANTVATVTKAEKSSKVGISLGRAGEADILLSKIEKDSLFADTNLRLGQKIVSINGVDCPSSTAEAIQLIKDCEGALAIVAVDVVTMYVTPGATATSPEPQKAEPKVEKKNPVEVTVSVEKPEKETKVGISVGRKGEEILIQKISGDGLFANCELKVGQKVVSINRTACPSNSKEAIDLIKESVGTLTIVAVSV